MSKIQFIKSKARASEIMEDDWLEIGGQKFRVSSTSLNGFGQIILTLYPIDEPETDQNMLIVAQHFLFTIYNQIPKK